VTPDQFHRAMTKDGFRPCRLLLRDGQVVHVLGENEYGMSQEGTLILGANLRQIKPADVERVEPLPYRVIDEDVRYLARARKALAEIRRRGLIPWAEIPQLLGLGGPAEGGET
jgi:hypothetical protein